MSGRHIETNGIRLYVDSAGDAAAPLIVFLHGFPEDRRTWKEQLDFFASRGFRVIAPDQRGYGLSEKPGRIVDYRVDELAADTIGIVDSLGVSTFKAVGHDWGAAVAWRIALKHPHRVEKLAVANMPHPLVFKRALKGNASQRRRSRYIAFFQIPRLPELILRLRRFGILKYFLKASSRPGAFTPETLRERESAWSEPGALRSMIHWYRAAFRHPTDDRCDPSLKMPVLIAWGELDRYFNPELADESLEYCLQGQLRKFPAATHWLHLEERQAFNESLAEFFASR